MNTRKHNGHDQPINGFSELGDLLSDPEAAVDADPNDELPFGDGPAAAVSDDTTLDTTDTLTLAGSVLSLSLHENALAEDRYFVCSLLSKIADAFQLQRINAEDLLEDMRIKLALKIEEDATDADGNPPAYSDNQLIFQDKLNTQLDANSYVVADLQRHFKAYNDTSMRKLHPRSDADVRKSFADAKARKAANRNGMTRAASEFEKQQATERRAQRAARIAATA